MKEKTLSQPAREMIKSYSNLDIGSKPVACTYFNNRRTKVRGGVRAKVGKGSPEEIKKEAKISAKKEGLNLEQKSAKNIKEFLVEKNIGVDCSAFAYYVLNAEVKAKKQESLKENINFPNKNWLRKLIIKFRTIENINTEVLSHPQNSTGLELVRVKPGDFVSILKSGQDNDRDHILVIHKVKYKQEKLQKIHYTHSFRWSSDGEYNHGIKKGKILIKDIDKSLLQQEWIEKSKKNKNNETYQRAKNAEILSLRRLNILT